MSDILRDNLLTFVLGGGNLFLVIKFFIERHDTKVEKEEKKQEKKAEKEEMDELGKINGEIVKLQGELKRQIKDGIRTQLLMLILLQPEEKKEILTVAQSYFIKLEGNWYMTSMFDKWCKKNNLKPEWFKGNQADIQN